MNINDVYKSANDHLKAGDLPKGKQVKVTIEGYEVVEFDDKPKIVLSFVGKDKTLVLNKTNATAIAGVHGDNTEAWKGKDICIYPTKTDFGGKLVDCIRVNVPMETVEAVPEPIPPQDELNDDIPF